MKPLRRFRSTLLSLSLITTMALGSTSVAHAFTPLPAIYEGSMRPYDFAECQPAAVPDSLQPFFIGYVGRHGARFLSSEKKVTKLEEAIAKARNNGSLTPLGEEFATLINKVKQTTDGRWGALDSVGADEQRRLARRMAEMWPTVTAEGTIKAKATYVPRVIMSMYEFAHSLATVKPRLDIYTAEEHRFDPLLRYFTTDSAYVNYLKEKPWQKEYDRFIDTHISPRPAEAIFGSTFNEKESRKLTLDIYSVIQSLRAAGLPAPDSRWMSPDEYKACWEAANLEHYFARTDNPLSRIPAEGAVPLLRQLIADLSQSTESKSIGSQTSDTSTCGTPSANTGALKANLYFGHAETLMPLLSLCDVKGCNAPTASVDKVAEEWQDYNVVPLGANFEIVLMRAPSGTIYALTRLNGKDNPIGPYATPLLPWSQLCSFWLSRIAQFAS